MKILVDYCSALPPFGNLFGVKTYVDEKLLQEEFVAFNAGSLTHSVKMKTSDYKKILTKCEWTSFIK